MRIESRRSFLHPSVLEIVGPDGATKKRLQRPGGFPCGGSETRRRREAMLAAACLLGIDGKECSRWGFGGWLVRWRKRRLNLFFSNGWYVAKSGPRHWGTPQPDFVAALIFFTPFAGTASRSTVSTLFFLVVLSVGGCSEKCQTHGRREPSTAQPLVICIHLEAAFCRLLEATIPMSPSNSRASNVADRSRT